MNTPSENAATVREALRDIPDVFWPQLDGHEQKLVEDARAALAALLAQAEAAEKLQSRIYVLENMRSENYIEALENAEADRDAAVREREQAQRALQRIEDESADSIAREIARDALLAQAEAGAEAENYATALDQIRRLDVTDIDETVSSLRSLLAECHRIANNARNTGVVAPDLRVRAEKAEADRDAAIRLLGQIKDDREVLYRQWDAAVRERDHLQRQLDAVDASLPPWEAPPDSDTGVVGRVQTILNLKADRRERDQAREALRFYADENNWEGTAGDGTASLVDDDGGAIARAALTGEGTT